MLSVLGYVAGLWTVWDALHRPAHVWVCADRSKGFWGTILVLLALGGPSGLFAATLYAVVLRARLLDGSRQMAGNPFLY